MTAPGSVTSTRSRSSCSPSSFAATIALALGEHRLDPLAELVQALADRAALLGRQRGDAAQALRQLGVAAQQRDARLLERSAQRGAANAVPGLLQQPVEVVCHWPRSLSSGP